MSGPYLTVEEAADYMRLAKATLYKKACKKEIPCRKHFGKLIFVVSELDEWSARRIELSVKPERPSQSPFESARERVRSLKTQSNAAMPRPLKKGA